MLAPYAAHPTHSRGRRYSESLSHYRNEYQRDRDRIIHCAAFRRLEYKTQVFVNHEGDMFRTRLTHSLEVAQISRTVARSLQLNEDLTEAIALAHDLGHTPFGHAGQDSLNASMRAYGGFEHNLQSLRIVDELEIRYPTFRGLNLVFETREGILKHCSIERAHQLGDVAARFQQGKPTPPSLEAQIANLCDAIAYNNHDIEDGLRAKLFTLEQLQELDIVRIHYDAVQQAYPHLATKRVIYEMIRRMIGEQVADVIENSRLLLAEAGVETLADVRAAPHLLIAFSPAMRAKQSALKRFLHSEMYQHYRVQRMAYKAAHIISHLFELLNTQPRLLPREVHEEITRLQTDLQDKTLGQARAVADYIAGMTDRYAIAEYERLFNPITLT